MPEKDINEAPEQAKAFFAKAEHAVREKDFESAIDMYIEGLRCDPNAVQDGHVKLRKLAIVRQEKGGAKPSSSEIAERKQGGTALEQMLGAEYLLAKDPTHLSYGCSFLRAAVSGGYEKAGKWIADLMFLANNRAKRPSCQLYVLLSDGYATIGHFDRAVAACQRAAKLRPTESGLAEKLAGLQERRSAASLESDELEELESLDESLEPERFELSEDTGAGRPVREPLQEPEHIDPALAKALACFGKARQVASVKNYDYAIELYLEGLRSIPEAVEDGHVPLCELAVPRKVKGGKKPSMMEKVKRLRGRTPLDQMLNAEYLFVKDPDHLPYAEGMLKAAIAGGYSKTANWIANFIFQTNNAASKPSAKTYVLLKDCYKRLDQFDKALVACQQAVRLKPQDAGLADELKNLTAEVTMVRGKYDQDGDFRESIKDRKAQEKLHAQDSVVKTEDYRVLAVEEARKALAQEPGLPRNIFNLAKVLSDLETDGGYSEAIGVLEEAYKQKNDFSYTQRAGEIRIRQLKHQVRQARAGAQGKSEVERLSARLKDTELEHWRLCVENYPTDLQAKYEYGVRLVGNKQYDEAIPLFQEAQRDPRHKISAMDKIGLCFFKKGWYADAIDVFRRALDAHEVKDDSVAKELRYNLARSHEKQGDGEKALEIYRKIAQVDFGFKDVRQRVDKLRSEASGEGGQ